MNVIATPPMAQTAPHTATNDASQTAPLQRTFRSGIPGRVAPVAALLALGIGLIVVMVIATGSGAYPMAPAEVVAILAQRVGIDLGIATTTLQEGVLMGIRLPRVLLGLLVGAGLGVAGAALQGLFRNPLADPQLIGVSAGAAFVVASIIVLGATTLAGLTRLLGPFTLPVGGFLGGLLTTFLIYTLARHEGRTSLATMLLAGIAVNAVAFAGIGFYSYLATDEQLRNLTYWTFGSLGAANWLAVGAMFPPLTVAFIALRRIAPGLNAWLLGEVEASHLGYDTQRLKRIVIVLGALITGFCVAVSGMIGFVALVAPHIVRLACGPDLRVVLPGAALLGALLLILADVVARTVVAPAELPIGIITALIGGPFFLIMLLKQRRMIAGL